MSVRMRARSDTVDVHLTLVHSMTSTFGSRFQEWVVSCDFPPSKIWGPWYGQQCRKMPTSRTNYFSECEAHNFVRGLFSRNNLNTCKSSSLSFPLLFLFNVVPALFSPSVILHLLNVLDSLFFMPPSRCFCLTSVCRTSGLIREQRGLGRLKLAQR